MIRLFLLLLVSIASCQTTDRRKGKEDKEMTLTPTYQNLKIDNRVDSILQKFIGEANCRNCINEMHIDKVRPDEIIIILKSRVYSIEYLRKTNPLFTSVINGVRFNVYSGLEDVYFGDNTHFDYSIKDSSNTIFKVWSLFVKPDSIRIEKDTGYPFFHGETPKIENKK